MTNSILQASGGAFSDAATLVRGETNPILVAYVVFSPDKGAVYRSNSGRYLHELLLYLSLPIYMQQAVAVPVDVLPFTERGKLDAKTLIATT